LKKKERGRKGKLVTKVRNRKKGTVVVHRKTSKGKEKTSGPDRGRNQPMGGETGREGGRRSLLPIKKKVD